MRSVLRVRRFHHCLPMFVNPFFCRILVILDQLLCILVLDETLVCVVPVLSLLIVVFGTGPCEYIRALGNEMRQLFLRCFVGVSRQVI
jgi:hypothetical protein